MLLSGDGTTTSKTVNQCSTLFSLFSVQLGQKMYLHEEKPNAKERLVEMMHARTPDDVKETSAKFNARL